jgi:hypothetical protein
MQANPVVLPVAVIAEATGNIGRSGEVTTTTEPDGARHARSDPTATIMNDSSGLTRPPRRPWPAVARTPPAIIATASLVLSAACGANPASTRSGISSSTGRTTSSQSTSSPSALSFSHCMRAHGVANFPDPASGGVLPKINVQPLGVSNSQFQSAQSACQNLLPSNGGSVTECFSTGDCPPALMQTLMNGMLRFAQCMRSHGVTNWPDPTMDSKGSPGFNLVAIQGTDWDSPQIDNTLGECQRALPGVRISLVRSRQVLGPSGQIAASGHGKERLDGEDDVDSPFCCVLMINPALGVVRW